MRVNVIDFVIHAFKRNFHAAHSPFTRRCDHIKTIRVSAIADHFGNNIGAACLRIFKCFQDQNTSPTSNNKSITISIISTACTLRGVVKVARHSVHRIKENG